MGASRYKKEISDSFNSMNTDALKQAGLILKETGNAKSTPDINNKKKLNIKLAKGIQQLDNGEGMDMGNFISGLKKKYGKR